MIHYRQDPWLGFCIVLQPHGSVLLCAVPRALIAGILTWLLMDYGINTRIAGGDVMWSPTLFNFFLSLAALVLAFHTNQAYQRFWEARSQVQIMASWWADAASTFIAVDEMHGILPGDLAKGADWRAHILHLLSLLHAVSIQYLLHNDAEHTHLEVLGGMDDFEAKLLSLTNDQTYLVMHWIVQEMMKRVVIDKGLSVPHPFASRIQQQLSNGMLAFNSACKIEDTPFPFPYVQLVQLMDWFMTIACPVVISSWMTHMPFAIILSIVSVGSFHSTFAAACAMENPFGRQSNDLPLVELHRDFVNRIKSIVDIHVASCLNQMILKVEVKAAAQENNIQQMASSPLSKLKNKLHQYAGGADYDSRIAFHPQSVLHMVSRETASRLQLHQLHRKSEKKKSSIRGQQQVPFLKRFFFSRKRAAEAAGQQTAQVRAQQEDWQRGWGVDTSSDLDFEKPTSIIFETAAGETTTAGLPRTGGGLAAELRVASPPQYPQPLPQHPFATTTTAASSAAAVAAAVVPVEGSGAVAFAAPQQAAAAAEASEEGAPMTEKGGAPAAATAVAGLAVGVSPIPGEVLVRSPAPLSTAFLKQLAAPESAAAGAGEASGPLDKTLAAAAAARFLKPGAAFLLPTGAEQVSATTAPAAIAVAAAPLVPSSSAKLTTGETAEFGGAGSLTRLRGLAAAAAKVKPGRSAAAAAASAVAPPLSEPPPVEAVALAPPSATADTTGEGQIEQLPMVGEEAVSVCNKEGTGFLLTKTTATRTTAKTPTVLSSPTASAASAETAEAAEAVAAAPSISPSSPSSPPGGTAASAFVKVLSPALAGPGASATAAATVKRPSLVGSTGVSATSALSPGHLPAAAATAAAALTATTGGGGAASTAAPPTNETSLEVLYELGSLSRGLSRRLDGRSSTRRQSLLRAVGGIISRHGSKAAHGLGAAAGPPSSVGPTAAVSEASAASSSAAAPLLVRRESLEGLAPVSTIGSAFPSRPRTAIYSSKVPEKSGVCLPQPSSVISHVVMPAAVTASVAAEATVSVEDHSGSSSRRPSTSAGGSVLPAAAAVASGTSLTERTAATPALQPSRLPSSAFKSIEERTKDVTTTVTTAAAGAPATSTGRITTSSGPAPSAASPLEQATSRRSSRDFTAVSDAAAAAAAAAGALEGSGGRVGALSSRPADEKKQRARRTLLVFDLATSPAALMEGEVLRTTAEGSAHLPAPSAVSPAGATTALQGGGARPAPSTQVFKSPPASVVGADSAVANVFEFAEEDQSLRDKKTPARHVSACEDSQAEESEGPIDAAPTHLPTFISSEEPLPVSSVRRIGGSSHAALATEFAARLFTAKTLKE